MKKDYFSRSCEDTERIGESVARAVSGTRRAFIALFGDLGVGKTAFTRGFSSFFGIKNVKSPTYAIVNEYPSDPPICHFDMYRIEGYDDLLSIGFYDYLDRDAYVICEWSENISDEIPDDAVYVTISKTPNNENERNITVESKKELPC